MIDKCIGMLIMIRIYYNCIKNAIKIHARTQPIKKPHK